MRRLLSAAFGTALCLYPALAWGQAAPAAAPLAATAAAAVVAQDADPALWVVRDADTTVYLFGTVHLLKPGLSWFDEAVRKAFDSSGELVTEIGEPNEAALQQVVIAKGVNATGPSLSQKLPVDKRAALARAGNDAGLPAQALERFDPWLAGMTLTQMALMKQGFDAGSGAEKTLIAAAKTSGKKLEALETAEQQIGWLDALSEPAQVAFLVGTVDEVATIGTSFNKMVSTWARGDADGIAAIMNESIGDSAEVTKVLLTDRNARWARWIEERLKRPGTVFIAVGAGHLAGVGSVQAKLAEHKLKAQRVAY